MKVLGTGESGYRAFYIVQISHEEVAKVADKAAYSDREKFPALKVGDEYPIGEGHDFRAEIANAVRHMTQAHEAFLKASATMTRFAVMVSEAEASKAGTP